MEKKRVVFAIVGVFVIVSGLLIALLIAQNVLAAPSLSVDWPSDEQIIQGETYSFSWTATGLARVKITTTGDLTDIPEHDRGQFRYVITDSPGSGSASWKAPFLDTITFKITARGFNRDGKEVASDEQTYTFRPSLLKDRHDDGIYIDVRDETRQRLYVLRGDKLTHAYLTSGSRNSDYYPRNVHPDKPHDHDGVFSVLDNHEVWHSKLFDVDMYWAMRYWNGHFIHGTYPNEYSKLGRPASSGCNRLEKEQAKELYDMTPVGTRVEIIAK